MALTLGPWRCPSQGERFLERKELPPTSLGLSIVLEMSVFG